ncbi:MAG: GNAT family N-acetyltransferase [Pseudomonadota bacterium]
MRFRHLGRIGEVGATAWNALFDAAYPFTQHAYLAALEDCGCATPERGWTPCHLVAEDDAGALIAAAPLYLKAHSWGEFVFDFSWADAAQRSGLNYYPKLLTAVPFTPATGPRLGAVDGASRHALLKTLCGLPQHAGLSSWHGLFMPEAELFTSGAHAPLLRSDVQFQWRNAGYADFTAFLAALSGDKRKKILQERRKVASLGWQFETLPGDAFSEAEWGELYALYANTYEERGQPPYLTLAFFHAYAMQPGTPVRVTVAREGSRFMAMALLVEGGDTLYGRHWGTSGFHDGLHFETCYYQGIDHCIRHGLSRYDAGAQGEHKLARGFDPVMTHSLHSFAEPRFAAAVAQALTRERRLVAARMAELQTHSAYKVAGAAA